MKRRNFLAGSTAAGLVTACGTKTSTTTKPIQITKIAKSEFTMDATAQGRMIVKGEVSSLELTNAAIDRAEEANKVLNFMVTPTFEQARERARVPLTGGSFTGVPMLTKDLQDTKGVRTAYGSRAFARYVPEENAIIVDVMEKNGLVSIGKSATPEFGFLPTTEPLVFGPARNPWNPAYSTGGSSGGSACAVAAGVVPFASASDGGGSIRIPSNCCGLFGMKGSRGRWPDADGSDWEISVRGFVSRSVRDGKTAMSEMGAVSSGLPAPILPGGRGMDEKYRIGFRTTTPDGGEVHPDCKKAVLLAAKHCEALGHEVEEADNGYSWTEFWDAFMIVWAFGAKDTIDAVGKKMGQKPPRELFEPFSWWLYELVEGKDMSVVATAYQQFAREREASRNFHKTYDFHLTPVLGEPPVKIGRIDQSVDPDSTRDWLEHYVGFTPWANATGHPAMSVPILRTAKGLPVGVQFEADYGMEANLFALAEQLEQIAPWAQDWPVIVS